MLLPPAPLAKELQTPLMPRANCHALDSPKELVVQLQAVGGALVVARGAPHPRLAGQSLGRDDAGPWQHRSEPEVISESQSFEHADQIGGDDAHAVHRFSEAREANAPADRAWLVDERSNLYREQVVQRGRMIRSQARDVPGQTFDVRSARTKRFKVIEPTPRWYDLWAYVPKCVSQAAYHRL